MGNGRREIWVSKSWRGIKKCDEGFENSDNELSVAKDFLFPSMKTTRFQFWMFCPAFGKVISKGPSERNELA